MSQELAVTIKGMKPLLQHSTAAMLVVDSKAKKVKSSEHDVVAEAEMGLYKDANGVKCIPFMHILSTMRKAAVNLKKGGAGKKTLKDFVFSGLEIKESLIPLDNQKHEVDIQIVKIGLSRIPRSRPRFDEWGATFHVSIIDTQTWDAGTVRQVLEEAGQYQGIGDFRPLYGTFQITKMVDVASGKEIK